MTGTTIKRLVLGAITLIVAALLSSSLLGSLSEPQITDRLQLYQTDLLLHATEIGNPQMSRPEPETSEPGTPKPDQSLINTRNALLGNNPLGEALKQYQEVRQSAATNLKQFEQRLQKIAPNPASPPATVPTPSAPIPNRSQRLTEPQEQVKTAIRQQQELLNQLDLRIGILEAEQTKIPAALETWAGLVSRLGDRPDTQSLNNTALVETAPLAETAKVLRGMWSDPPRLLPNAEPIIQKNLEGWFRYKALSRLYQLQQRSDVLVPLQAAEQKVAQQTLVKLAIVGTLPTLGGLVGLVLLIVMGIRAFLRSRQKISGDANLVWNVPWEWDTIVQVLVVGFFFMGQIVIPVIVGAFGVSFSAFGIRARAAYTLTYYLLMAGSGLAVLYFSVKPFFPLPEGWFRATGKRNWMIWGVGGYFVALPLMLITSILNQLIWQGQGGSNPLLQIVLEEGDPIALTLFFITASIAAPVFEELFFRGFLLPSLTRYLPVWGAIGLSALIFATAHLSLSEVLPLTVLGAVLGFVYTRSRGLLASMLLHSLWNSVTMIGLFLLGSGVK
ncbi:MAG: CPBP family intramembrane metalloprotease [Leptolyngbyaceae cyanobacterium CRU_2_3]|nr:CPBP family intramembrane metalloprotease [Leptolyngbyaceae cyanobacterium CRU_2_3]